MQGFGIPPPDDPMETDAGRRAGQVEDIDIDLDLTEEQQQDLEDEYMGEDITINNNQGTGMIEADDVYNDDEMVDDGNAEQNMIYEASIQDEDLQDAEEINDIQPNEDDEIVDVLNDEPLPTPHIQAIPQHQEATKDQ